MRRMMTAILFCTYLALLLNCHCFGQIFDRDEIMLDSGEQEPVQQIQTEMIRHKSGSELILKCKTQSCVSKWEFAPCKPCLEKVFEWRVYDKRTDRRKKCQTKLHMKNVSSLNNGLYRCFVNSSIESTYEVDIIEIAKYDGEPPKVLEIFPMHSTIGPHSDVVTQCKVFSRHVPVILWFKQSDSSAKYDVEYSDKFYTRINTTHHVYPMPHEDDVYVSKLNLRNTTVADDGVYVCVVMTDLGRDYQNFTISVVTSNAKHHEQPNSLSLLFLIPLVFLMIPAVVWLCYYKNKNAKMMKNKQLKQDQALI